MSIVLEFYNIPTEYEANTVQERATRTPQNVIFKGFSSALNLLFIVFLNYT